MNRKRTIAFGLIALILMIMLAAPTPTYAQETRKAGLNSAIFLNVGVGARAVGLGSATTSMANDVSQIFWNPAGIALENEQLQASFSYNRWLGDLKHNAGAVSYKLKDIGTFGIGVIIFGVSDIPADRDIYDAPDLKPFQIDQATSATYNYRDISLGLSYARYFFDRLALGATVKLVTETIDDQTVSAVAFDLGSIYKIGFADWQIGARLQNIGSDIKYYDITYNLPLTFSIGTSIKPVQDKEKMNSLMISIDGVKRQDGPQYVYVGSEFAFQNLIFLRAGWKFNYSSTATVGTSTRPEINSTIEGLSAGAGINVTVNEYNVKVDYAFTKMDLFNDVHRVTVHFGMK
jgi:hypothetical protein